MADPYAAGRQRRIEAALRRSLDVECVHLREMIAKARTVLNDEFGHADAPYTPAALQALAILDGPLIPHRPIGFDGPFILDCEVCGERWPCAAVVSESDESCQTTGASSDPLRADRTDP